jgi:hypothetical protein
MTPALARWDVCGREKLIEREPGGEHYQDDRDEESEDIAEHRVTIPNVGNGVATRASRSSNSRAFYRTRRSVVREQPHEGNLIARNDLEAHPLLTTDQAVEVNGSQSARARCTWLCRARRIQETQT